jgi:branched-chain amino acid transport system ATP-binding protein
VSTSTEPLLQARELTFAYKRQMALRGVSIEVGEGEAVAVVGANGAGKSTFARVVAGLAKPRSGEVMFAGSLASGLKPDQVVHLGMALVPEGRALFSRLTVRENILLGAYTRRHVSETALLSELEGLFPEIFERLTARAGTLSGGQQQMLAIARALSSQPRLVIIDEPTMGLAPTIVQRVAAIVRRLRSERGMSILLLDQRRTLAQLCDCRGYVIRSGEIQAEVAVGHWDDEDTARHYMAGHQP